MNVDELLRAKPCGPPLLSAQARLITSYHLTAPSADWPSAITTRPAPASNLSMQINSLDEGLLATPETIGLHHVIMCRSGINTQLHTISMPDMHTFFWYIKIMLPIKQLFLNSYFATSRTGSRGGK